MKYTGSFGLKRNGSDAIDIADKSEYSRAAERDYRKFNATTDDVLALVNGAGFTVRFGKQTLGYFSTQRQAVFEAGRRGGKAYKIAREGRQNSSTLVVLIPIEEGEESDSSPSAAELIAEKIRDQIGAGDAPLSPLAKQRVVMMLFSFCKDKEISEECFAILYPVSTKEQFDRLWRNLSEKETPTQITTKENFLQYADGRGLLSLANKMMIGDRNGCLLACSDARLSEAQFEDLYENSNNNGIRLDSKLIDALRSHIARDNVERRIDGDIFRMLKNDDHLRRMAVSGNSEGIADYLTSNGYSNREAREAGDEIVSIGKLVNKM